MKFTLPALRKLAKNGSNDKLMEWLNVLSDASYQNGYKEGLEHAKEIMRRLDNESDTSSTNIGGVGGEPQGD